jgi:serine/threonine protein kinase
VVPQHGDEIGRFTVLESLGEGGMGVVLAAYDPLLDRKVALKLLRSELTPAEDGTDARARLKREAQAMARLRHPSVVTVFEVGEYEHQVFLAMEYVPGGTLGEWADRHRSQADGWRKIVAAYVKAGEGLVAAHAQGLIHRDFKPANVLVDGDRFQVTDFGISSHAGDVERAPASDRAPSTEETSLTRTGLLMGTAPYMAPERHNHRPATPATDQFAFCVALFESLFGYRPFSGKTSTAVAQAILDGDLRPPPVSSDVPEFIRKAILRGLSADPADRFPSMAELLRVLGTPEEADVGRRTRQFVGGVIGLCFIALPVLSARYAIPADISTYRGTIIQTLILLGLLLALGYWARESLRATPRNRQAFLTLSTMLVLQIPFELGHAAAGLSVLDSHVLHLFYWGAVGCFYGILADRRFLALAACYLAAYATALAYPQHYEYISSAAAAAFVVAVVAFNRGGRPVAA